MSDELRLAMVSLVLGMGDDEERASACEALLARDEVVTVRVGRGEEPTVFRADVAGATPAACGITATTIAREVAARLGVEPRGIDVRVLGPSAEEPVVMGL